MAYLYFLITLFTVRFVQFAVWFTVLFTDLFNVWYIVWFTGWFTAYGRVNYLLTGLFCMSGVYSVCLV